MTKAELEKALEEALAEKASLAQQLEEAQSNGDGLKEIEELKSTVASLEEALDKANESLKAAKKASKKGKTSEPVAVQGNVVFEIDGEKYSIKAGKKVHVGGRWTVTDDLTDDQVKQLISLNLKALKKL